jgi:hypothetical protein
METRSRYSCGWPSLTLDELVASTSPTSFPGRYPQLMEEIKSNKTAASRTMDSADIRHSQVPFRELVSGDESTKGKFHFRWTVWTSTMPCSTDHLHKTLRTV